MNKLSSLFINNTPTKRRFKVSTKKRVWMKARKNDPDKWRTGFIKTSYCMNKNCKKQLKWDKRHEFEFDHLNNDPSNNSEKNCFLVCNDCHKKHTVIGKRRQYNQLGMFTRYQTIRKKVGYKKKRGRNLLHPKRKRVNNYSSLSFMSKLKFIKY